MASPVENSSTNQAQIKNVSYTHDAMIDMMIANPKISGNELASHFGYAPAWVSTVRNSNAFQARMAQRKKELVDPLIIATVDEQLRAVADASLSKIIEKLASPINQSDDFILQSAKLATGALGYGARPAGGATQSTNVAVVIQVPPKIASSAEWASAYAAKPLAQRVDSE